MSAQPASDPLSPPSRRFVLHWGEMGSRWGVNRTVAQIHARLPPEQSLRLLDGGPATSDVDLEGR